MENSKNNILEQYLDSIFPNHDELQRNEEGLFFVDVIDQELDLVRVYFNGDEGIEIITEELTYIELDKETLLWLADCIDYTQRVYANEAEEKLKNKL